MNRFRKMGFIDYNGNLQVNRALLTLQGVERLITDSAHHVGFAAIRSQDQSGDPGRNGGHNPLAGQLLHEPVQEIGLHSLQWRTASPQLTSGTLLFSTTSRRILRSGAV
jgi:hypothetical protein